MTVVEPQPWTGRDDGAGPEHLRWHRAVRLGAGTTDPALCALVGFRSDEGVRRNKGRLGARSGPGALRRALASMALPIPVSVVDAGDVEVGGDDLEGGQRRLGEVVTSLLDDGHYVTVLGGGHEVAFGSYLGLVGSERVRGGARFGVLNLDAHFDLRTDPVPSSGTPFTQMAEAEQRRCGRFDYSVVGISQPSNTTALFRTAERLGVRYLTDDECGVADRERVRAFVAEFLAAVDLVYLTVDLDVLPAAVAPGVSAPAAYGVPLETVQSVCDQVADSGKLALCDVAELNPDLDVDGRTARVAARLVHRTALRRAAQD